MYPKQQTFLVLGLSRSGTAVAEFLLCKQARVYVYDDVSSARLETTANELQQKGAIFLKKVINRSLSGCLICSRNLVGSGLCARPQITYKLSGRHGCGCPVDTSAKQKHRPNR